MVLANPLLGQQVLHQRQVQLDPLHLLSGPTPRLQLDPLHLGPSGPTTPGPTGPTTPGPVGPTTPGPSWSYNTGPVRTHSTPPTGPTTPPVRSYNTSCLVLLHASNWTHYTSCLVLLTPPTGPTTPPVWSYNTSCLDPLHASNRSYNTSCLVLQHLLSGPTHSSCLSHPLVPKLALMGFEGVIYSQANQFLRVDTNELFYAISN